MLCAVTAVTRDVRRPRTSPSLDESSEVAGDSCGREARRERSEGKKRSGGVSRPGQGSRAGVCHLLGLACSHLYLEKDVLDWWLLSRGCDHAYGSKGLSDTSMSSPEVGVGGDMIDEW
ncbi:unnamed protein product [Pleuronectes platessa]|uniref:Uncharacterized protein n=1 Tax=Pleuronectes platessa TaxID=8262 RepID=A0A9N7V5X5_PLEPL|nr:unnamed protein product [Pleuronectes platessa]